jgi:peptidoglycan/xylan/chitin deacetylase (PgdA/CDA1 family)
MRLFGAAPRLTALLLLASMLVVEAAAGERRIAVTFDDLPGPPGGLLSNDVPELRRNTARLLHAVLEREVPAVGFVNEGKLFLEGEAPEQAEERKAVLAMWVEAGLELGNHTYSHPSLNKTPLEEFEEDLLRGEPVTRVLLAKRGRSLRYFRHPFLQVGLDLEKRRAFEAFLQEHGYVVAPVTVDNDDYVFASVYTASLRRGDRETATRVGAAYLRYMESVFAFVEHVSQRLLGRQVRQVLLLHANALNADCFGDLARSLEKRGYRFVTLENALEDAAYSRPDTYVGAWGISWLHHWELTSGRKRSPSPDPPTWITEAYEALGR